MLADQLPGWYETDDDRLTRLASIVQSKRGAYEGLRRSNMPTDEIARARALNALQKAHAELDEAEDDLRHAIAEYYATSKPKSA